MSIESIQKVGSFQGAGNVVYQNLVGSPTTGDLWFDYSNVALKMYNGVEWTAFSNTTGDITGVTAGLGLSGGGLSGVVTLDLDFSELTNMTGDISGTTEFIIQDATTESRKAASGIKLSAFNNDSGWTDNDGTVTSIATSGTVNGLTLTGGPITDTGTITLGGAINNLLLTQLDPAAVILSSESFADINTAVLTAAATDDRILSYGYSTTTGTVTSIGVSGGAGLTSTGGPITSSGTITLAVGAGTGLTVNADDIAITNTGVTAQQYGDAATIPVVTVNAQGQITLASELSIAIDASQITSGTIDTDRLTDVTLDNVTDNGNTTTNDITVGNLTSTGIDDNATSTAITIDANENVGIGTSSPVNSAGYNTVTVGQVDGAQMIFKQNNANEGFIFTSANNFDIGALGNFNIHAGSSGGVGGRRLTIDTAGNVGIGSSAPTHSLTINGQDYTGAPTAGTYGTLGLISGAALGSGGSVTFGALQSSNGFAAIKGHLANGSTNSQGDLAFYTRNVTTDAAMSERMRIDSSGDLIMNGGAVQTTILTTGSSSTAGTMIGDWTLPAGSTFQATYADLAEKYTTDAEYEAGTVLKFGGDAELTQSDTSNDFKVAGVVSTNPAYILNAEIEGQYLALSGRVPVKVTGSVCPGDILVSSNVPGHAEVNNNARSGRIIGKAITNDANGVCEALVTLM